MYSKNKIALIGMPLSGKSTVAKALSMCMKVHYADLDDEVEKKHGSIASIFAERGEKEFRKIEECTLQELFKKHKDDMLVLSTGGGTPLCSKAVALLKQHCIVVWLRISLEALLYRVADDEDHRPLLAKEKEKNMKMLYEQRQDIYAFANIIVDVEQKSVEEIVQEIKKAVGIN